MLLTHSFLITHCRLADVIAYVNHDVGDAVRAGIIREEELPEEVASLIGRSHSARINTMVCDVIEHSWSASGIDTGEPPVIGMSPAVLAATDALRRFLFARVYDRHSAEAESERARLVVRRLYEYFNEHETRLPPEYSFYSDEVARRVVDYIAGMTDQYALNLAEELLLI